MEFAFAEFEEVTSRSLGAYVSVHAVVAPRTDFTYEETDEMEWDKWESWQTLVGDLAGCLFSILA